ncbi:MAG: NUDIX domain-containing protein [Bacteroidetes bacterium]|nr:NUDIX domain-containing protein [Bacteroidota bacterium]
MYKIFINNIPLHIAEKSDSFSIEKNIIRCESENVKELLEIIRKAHSGNFSYKSAWFITGDPEKILKQLKKELKYIKAAGGRVKNKDGKILFIFRYNKWDLPKGKIEKGEDTEQAAIREVEEECGIAHLKITKELSPTYHTYLLKGKIVLKKTSWFEMKCDDERNLIPQKEEGITDVKWLDENEVKKAMENTYESVKVVMSDEYWLLGY